VFVGAPGSRPTGVLGRLEPLQRQIRRLPVPHSSLARQTHKPGDRQQPDREPAEAEDLVGIPWRVVRLNRTAGTCAATSSGRPDRCRVGDGCRPEPSTCSCWRSSHDISSPGGGGRTRQASMIAAFATTIRPYETIRFTGGSHDGRRGGVRVPMVPSSTGRRAVAERWPQRPQCVGDLTQPYRGAFRDVPGELARRCILAGCPRQHCPRPFGGSGTTALVARDLGRRSILVELNPDYAELAARRLQQLSLLA
jgi:hypothetical protein